MAGKNEKLLLPMKEIVKLIAKEKDLIKHVADLKKFIQKGTFFQYHSFVELLDVLIRNSDLRDHNKREVLNLLKEILTTGPDKGPIFDRFYSFIIKNSDRLNALDDFIFLTQFDEEPKLEKQEMIFYITEKLLKVAQKPEQLEILQRNYGSFLTRHCRDEKLSVILIQSVSRSISRFCVERKWSLVVTFLEKTLLKAISKESFQVSCDEMYREILNMINYLSKYGHGDAGVIQVLQKITKELRPILQDPIQKNSNEMLVKVFSMCCKSKIHEEDLKSFYMDHFKQKPPLYGEHILTQKTASIIALLFAKKIQLLEMTAECLSTYHHSIVGLFLIFKHIKNEEGYVSCCSDAKRHETFSLILTIFFIVRDFVEKDLITSSVANIFLYHVKYGVQICNEFKCQSKEKETKHLFSLLHNVLHGFFGKSSLASIISYVDEYTKILFKLWNSLAKEDKTNDPHILVLKLYEEPKGKKHALISANGIASVIRYRMFIPYEKSDEKTEKKILMKFMFSLREATKILNFKTSTEFIKSDQYKDNNFAVNAPKISIPEFILLDMSAMFRIALKDDSDLIGKLFIELINEAKDSPLIAQACQMITDEMLKSDETLMQSLQKINKDLEVKAKKKFDFDVSLALALNNYSLYFVMDEQVTSVIKEAQNNKFIERLELKKELELLGYLNESLKHFTDVVSHLQAKKDDLGRIISMSRLQRIFNNMALQYHMRGVKYKELEAFNLLWHFIELNEQSNSVEYLNVATFFLDNQELLIDSSGNYIKISKKLKSLTVEEILAKANQILDKDFIPEFQKKTEPTQCYVLSYLLSLWVYYLAKGKKSSGFKAYEQFKMIKDEISFPEDSSNHLAIIAKVYFCLVEINMICKGRSADNFLSNATATLMSIKIVDRDFFSQFYQIYHRITIKAINSSLNRHSDMNHYDVVMLSLISGASRKGHCLRVLDLLSLSILRNLNMEKVEQAKSQLKDLTKLLGLKEEILIETPTKAEAPVTVFDYELHQEGIRKAAVAPNSPIQCEISMIYESSEMSRQLENFIHVSSCSCEICKIPQLKFTMFQIGCHYSRLLWLMDKKELSLSFNKFAFEPWQNICDKLRRVKDNEFLMINKIDFAVFSLRWLFQFADTLMSMKLYEEIEEIWQEIELICTDKIPDFNCFQEKLFCRKENLNFILEHGLLQDKSPSPNEISFAGFMKTRPESKTSKKKQEKSPVLLPTPKRPFPILEVVKDQEKNSVYIDLSDEEEIPVVVKAKTASVKKAATSSLTFGLAAASRPTRLLTLDKSTTPSTSLMIQTPKASSSKKDSKFVEPAAVKALKKPLLTQSSSEEETQGTSSKPVSTPKTTKEIETTKKSTRKPLLTPKPASSTEDVIDLTDDTPATSSRARTTRRKML